jgi:hypothetical protein
MKLILNLLPRNVNMKITNNVDKNKRTSQAAAKGSSNPKTSVVGKQYKI